MSFGLNENLRGTRRGVGGVGGVAGPDLWRLCTLRECLISWTLTGECGECFPSVGTLWLPIPITADDLQTSSTDGRMHTATQGLDTVTYRRFVSVLHTTTVTLSVTSTR